jgi:adenylate cyclase
MTEALRLAQHVIDLSEGDPTTGAALAGSPLVMAIEMRGLARLCLGIKGWRSDAETAIAMAASLGPTNQISATLYKYVVAIPVGALPADSTALRETADALRIAERVGNEYTLALARLTRGVVLVRHGGPDKDEGFDLLIQARSCAREKGFTLNALAVVDPELARESARNGDLDRAIELSRAALDDMFDKGSMFLRGVAATILVESLLQRGAANDLQKAQDTIDRLAAVPVDPGFVLHEIPLLRLRALVARARGDDVGNRELIERHRAMVSAADFMPLTEDAG